MTDRGLKVVDRQQPRTREQRIQEELTTIATATKNLGELLKAPSESAPPQDAA